MKTHSYTQLVKAMLFCLPMVLAGCATRYVPKPLPELMVNAENPVAKTQAVDPNEGMKLIPGTGVFVKPPVAQAPTDGVKDILLNFEGADLREVVRVTMGDMLHENYTIDPRVNGTVTIHTSQAVSKAAVPAILETVLRANGAAMVRENGVYKIAPLNSALRGNTTPQVGNLQPGYNVQVVPLEYISAREMAKILEPLLPEGSILRVDETRNLLMLAGAQNELRHALETVNVFDLDWLAGMSVGLFTLKSADVKTVMPEIELLFGDKSKGPFAGMLRVIPMERMNALLVVSPRPQYLEQARVWVERLDRNSGKGGTRLHVYPMQNGNAEKVAALLSQVISSTPTAGVSAQPTVAPGLSPASVQTGGAAGGTGLAGATSSTGALGSAALPGAPTAATPGVVASGTGEALGLGAASSIKVIADRDNNSLLIMANSAEYEKIEEAIKRLDVVPRQVLVEVTIAEVQLDGALSYGLEWFFSGNNNVTGSLRNSGGIGAGLTTPTGPVSPQLPFSAVWRGAGGNIKAVLSALAKTTNVNVLSSPHIMVTDNQVAKINVGSSVPVQGQSTLTGTNVVTSVNYVDTGVVLSVRPHINSGGLVTLEISQEVSDVVAAAAGAINSPSINKRSAQTTVAVQSGDTMVLGGLIKDNKQKGSAGLPYLSELPVVGALFGAKTETTTRSEMIITITPRVVTDYQQAREATAEFRQKLSGIRKLNPEALGLVKEEKKYLFPLDLPAPQAQPVPGDRQIPQGR
ncbi:MAG: type II secretion system secretin GspD [Polaromonas sp.]